MDYVNASVSAMPNTRIDAIKQESNLGFFGFGSNIATNSFYSSQLPKKMKALLRDSEEQRNKHANSVLVHFLFTNDVLDMIVFLALRHHKQITIAETELTQKTSLAKAHINQVREYLSLCCQPPPPSPPQEKMIHLRERSISVLKCVRELMKSLVYQLDSYGSAVAPYVHRLLENLVKFFIGEEYKLQSDLIS